MSDQVATLINQLAPDEWRQEVPFSGDLAPFHQQLVEATSDSEAEGILRQWLQKHQPCLFGRLAAKMGALSFCILRESDLAESDLKIKQKIQDRRLAWSRAAFHGHVSAFIVIAISDKIARSVPSAAVATLAQRLAYLYLLQDIHLDRIYTDEIALEFPGEAHLTRIWPTGVNYFCANADGRWWHDHRIPGGLAFSVNSVGHLVKSGRVNQVLQELAADLPDSDIIRRSGYQIDTLQKALEFAMRTISLAKETVSGRATELLPLQDMTSDMPTLECPVELPGFLRDKNFCEYIGRYHTDMTLPSEYFRADVTRPEGLPIHRLDFTYLFHKHLENADFDVLADGRRIRGREDTPGVSDTKDKLDRGHERVVQIQDTQLLRLALDSSAEV